MPTKIYIVDCDLTDQNGSKVILRNGEIDVPGGTAAARQEVKKHFKAHGLTATNIRVRRR